MKEKSRQEYLNKISKALKRRHDVAAKIRSGVPISGGSKRPRKITLPRRVIRSNSIFLSGSIGDVLALESFMSGDERAAVHKIFYGTQKKGDIETLLSSVPTMPNLKDHVSVWSDFSNMWCFFSKDECVKKVKQQRRRIVPDFERSEDFSIMSKFNQIMNGDVAYTGSSFLKHRLADVSAFGLPGSYVVVCPYSTDKRIADRDFTHADWEECLKYLGRLGVPGVVLNIGGDLVPDSPALVNLSNKTTITEAVEILKGATGYVGIDSSLSVLAAKLFVHPRLLVKSVNHHCYRYAKCYYAPQTDFGFIAKAIVAPDDVGVAASVKAGAKAITLNVCQGVGDIFWVYQKFSPYFDTINFCISQIPSGAKKVQTRAADFLRILPKTGDVTYRMVTTGQYDEMFSKVYKMSDILEGYAGGRRNFDYSCNLPLEQGVRIEDIDPEYLVEETVDITTQYIPMEFEPGGYVTVYISGTTLEPDAAKRCQLWTPAAWHRFIDLFYKKYALDLPVLVIGASYDENAADRLIELLDQSGFRTRKHMDILAPNAAYILKHSHVFLAYQSGLSILADNLGTKQVMLYFPYLRPMLYTWCKNKHVADGTFNANTFDKTPEEVIESLKLNFVGKDQNG